MAMTKGTATEARAKYLTSTDAAADLASLIRPRNMAVPFRAGDAVD
jgi:hypothetical protein